MEHTIESSKSDTGMIPAETDLCNFILEKTKGLGSLINLLVFKHNEVQIGLIQSGAIILERSDELIPGLLKELRAFSDSGELYIWNHGGILKYRLRIDGSGDEELYPYEEEHYMWGTKVEDGVIMEENRGMKYTMPFPSDQIKTPLKYKVKNYYTFDELGLIRFVDARLVEFINGDNRPFSL